MNALKQSLPYQQHQHLRMAADAARATMAQLQREYQTLAQQASNVIESMQRLQGVIDAWNSVSAEERLALSGEPGAAWPREAEVPRADILERVHAVLLPGLPLSATEAHAAIEARFHRFDSLSAVGLTLREGVIAGRYVYNGRTGQYRISAE